MVQNGGLYKLAFFGLRLTHLLDLHLEAIALFPPCFLEVEKIFRKVLPRTIIWPCLRDSSGSKCKHGTEIPAPCGFGQQS